MSPAQSAIRRYLRPKYVAFLAIAVVTVYVLNHNERWMVDANDPLRGHFLSIRQYLFPHAVAGALALFLAPFQFPGSQHQRSDQQE